MLHTPGHTRGSVCYVIGGLVFSGDTLFKGVISHAGKDVTEEERQLMSARIREKLFSLPDTTRVYPAHREPTAIGWEKKTNPFLTNKVGNKD